MNSLAKHSTSWLLLCTAVSIVGCGEEIEQKPEPASAIIGEAPSSTPTDAVTGARNSVPQITRVLFDPDESTTGVMLKVNVDTVDDDGDNVWVTYEWTIEDRKVGGNESQISLEGVARYEVVSVTVIATDGKDTSPPVTETIEVRNALPSIQRVGIAPKASIHRGQTIVLRPEARDADGDEISFRYEWTVNGRPARQDGSEFSTERLHRGDVVQGAVIARDDRDEAEPFLTPELRVENAPPTFLSMPDGTSNDGFYRYHPEVEDRDGDILSFSLEGAPTGMQIDAESGSISWQPADDQGGIHQPIVVVEDSRGGRARQELEVSVGDTEGQESPARGDF